MKKIYFENANTESIQSLLKSGFTYASGNIYKFVRTYNDLEFRSEECHPARRSFLDLYYICKTYFPDVTQKEVATVMSKVNNLGITYCSDIHKYVFYKAPYAYIYLNRYVNGDYSIYHINPERYTVDNFTLIDLKKLLTNQ